MPELPEVETVRRGLSELIVGKTITTTQCSDSPKSFPNDPHAVQAFVHGATITSIRRRAKVLLIDLSTQYTLVVHLKMTGQLVYRGEQTFGAGHPNDSLIGKLPDRSTRVTITFDDGSHLYFNDQRKFGWIRLLPTMLLSPYVNGAKHNADARKRRGAQQVVDVLPRASTEEDDAVDARDFAAVIDFMQKVGPEPLEDSFTAEQFIPRVRRRNNTSIKAAILDQTVLAGVGNIYADESLWGAQLHPSTRVRDIPDEKLAELLNEIKYVMNLSIEKGGSTDKNYVNAEGKRGSYIDFARVFRREGQACPHCGTTIDKLRVAGRGTHVCPVCQVQ